MQNFRKIAKLRCREICEPQNREINVSRKFHVIRYFEWRDTENQRLGAGRGEGGYLSQFLAQVLHPISQVIFCLRLIRQSFR